MNSLRRDRGLPPVSHGSGPVKITRALVRQITLEAWQKYPQIFTDPNYELGELTLDLVKQEIQQRIDDLKRGVVVRQAALKDYFN